MAPGVSACVSMIPWTPVASTWLNIHALARTAASSMPFTGTFTITARTMAALGRSAGDEALHIVREPLDVVRRVLHVVADVVRVRLRVRFAGVERAFGTRV